MFCVPTAKFGDCLRGDITCQFWSQKRGKKARLFVKPAFVESVSLKGLWVMAGKVHYSSFCPGEKVGTGKADGKEGGWRAWSSEE